MVLDYLHTAVASREPPEPEEHNAFLSALAETPLESLSYEDRFLIYHYLQKLILCYAHAWEDENKTRQSEKLAAIFSDELQWIGRIAAATQYSPVIYGWADVKRKELLDALRQPALAEKLAAWPRLSFDERRELIGGIVQLQADLYGFGAFRFAPPPLEVHDKGADASVSAAHSLECIDPAAVPVALNQALFEEETPAAALLLAHHETIHHLTLQLAMAVHNGRLSSDHPLYPDAAIRLARIVGRGTAYAQIAAAYDHDGEENLAYDQQGRLYRELYGEPSRPAAVSPITPPALR